jgi:hypothetical protein
MHERITVFWLESLKGREHVEDLGVDESIILGWIFEKLGGSCGLSASGSGQKQVASYCEHDNEPSGSIKGGEFLDYLSVC